MESQGHWYIDQMSDLTVTPGRRAAQEAFRPARIGPADIDVFEPYDSFTITVLLAIDMAPIKTVLHAPGRWTPELLDQALPAVLVDAMPAERYLA